MSDRVRREIKSVYCYASKDEDFYQALDTHLAPLKRTFGLRTWNFKKILPSEKWEDVISQNIEEAHLILLLISPDFLDSDYCYTKEMQRALARHREGSCRVIPVLLRPALWQYEEFFNQLQMLPQGARPIAMWDNRDEAYNNIASEIGRVLKDLRVALKTKEDWLAEGQEHTTRKQYREALAAFARALELDPHFLDAYHQQGIVFMAQERYNEALASFTQALKLDPDSLPSQLMQGKVLLSLERYEEALTLFEKLIQLNSRLVEAYIGRDEALVHLGASWEQVRLLQQNLRDVRHQLRSKGEQNEQLGEEVQQLRQQLSRVRKHSGELEAQFQEAKDYIDSAHSQLLEKLDGTVQELQEHLTTTQKQLEQVEVERQQIHQNWQEEQARSTRLEAQLQETQQELAQERERNSELSGHLQGHAQAAASTREAAEDALRVQEKSANNPPPHESEPVPNAVVGPNPGEQNASDSESAGQQPATASRISNMSVKVAFLCEPGNRSFLHVANTDGLFIAQGSLLHTAQYGRFGLFILAQGRGEESERRKTMSNLTIQTMIDALLPRLYSRDALDIQAYTGLLRESIQRSQQAAFRRYGTTSGGLSAALVIDGIACIALARDCRIYLYDNHLSLLIAGVSPAPGDVEDDAHSPANVQVLDRPSGQASSGEFGLSVVSLDAGNKLFFCTGELCSMISDADIAEIFRKRPRALEKICGAILEMAHTGEGNDLPVSMIVGQFNHGSSALFTPLIDVNLTVHAKPEAVTIPPLPLPSGRKPPSKKK